MPTRTIDRNAIGQDEDWEGNNAAFTCPLCRKVSKRVASRGATGLPKYKMRQINWLDKRRQRIGRERGNSVGGINVRVLILM
jgi:hypothetical protein